MKAKVYIETSVVSYRTARRARDLIIAARQEITHSRWPRIRRDFDCYVSALVVQEATGLPVLQISEDAERLAESLVTDGPISRNKPEDALHIALAACNGIDYLLTWNFTHIHNAQMEVAIRRIVEYRATSACHLLA